MRIGLLAILVGVVYLLKNLGFITGIQWNIIWPIIVIYLGIAAVARDRCWHCGVWHDGGIFGKHGHDKNLCNCDCDGCEDCKH